MSKIGLRANSDNVCRIRRAILLDRVLVKDRLESKLRLLPCFLPLAEGWIGSLSKIGLRANSDLCGIQSFTTMLDRVLVKDRLESKLRRQFGQLRTRFRWIGSLSKIGLRANSDACRLIDYVITLDRVLVKDRLESKLRHGANVVTG